MSSFKIPKKRPADDSSSPMPIKQQYPHASASYGMASSSKAKACTVKMNGFAMRINKKMEIVRYELRFQGLIVKRKTGQEIEKDLAERVLKDDVSLQLRRRAFWDIFQNLLKQDDRIFGTNKYHFVYDCGVQFYSMDELFPKSETKSGSIDMRDLEESSKAFLGSIVRINYTIKNTGTFSLGADVGDVGTDRSVQQFLELLTTQGLYAEGARHLLFRNQRYDVSDREEVVRDYKVRYPYPFCVKLGAGKSVCLSRKNDEKATATILQLEKKTTPFFPEMTVIDFVEQCETRNMDAVERWVKGLVVVTTHLRRPRCFRVSGFTKQDCNSTYFTKGDQEIGVADYFRQQYKIDTRAGRLPCIEEKKKRSDGSGHDYSYYPMDTLRIVKGQRILDKKQTPEIVDHLIKSARVLPSAMLRDIEEELRKLKTRETERYLEAFAISICPQLLESNAKVLEPPNLEYGGSAMRKPVTEGGGKNAWPDNNTTFFRPGRITDSAKGLDRWLFVYVNLDSAEVGGLLHSFLDRFVRSAKERGIKLEKPQDMELDTRGKMGDELWKTIVDLGKVAYVNEVKYIMFVQRERKDIPRDMMKLLETYYKVTTQQIALKTVEKANSNKGAQMVIDNILKKTNEKLGGLNARVRPQPEIGEWFHNDVMFMGLDISHPGIGGNTPTVVGMAFTKNSDLEVAGRVWYQEPREHLLENMKRYIKEAIEEFRKSARCYPATLFVYRGGVSEGEYEKLEEAEISQFKEAFKEIDFPGKRRPSLKYITVQRNSGYRLMPQRQHDFRGQDPIRENVLPGTCADSGIVNEANKEFVLVPHQAIQGTAKPSKYVLIHNEHKQISMDHLEKVTNTLCYMHGIVASPVSCPSILYQAGDLAKRGMANYKSYMVRKPTLMPPEQATDQQRKTHIDWACEKMNVILNHKFWA
ncbi:hypothetical protein QR680_005189 [Steinernema hermaphroditum]|uniref:Piwi domain-containing protein n=1 Tax=Steinernema hermaphroditum TaxID=289476 RepID=A0AA39HS80_9BILA|nr:hypothetical protein QR680_005189 [Steinernema hermaphroditum]